MTRTESAGYLLYAEETGDLRFVAAVQHADRLLKIPVPIEQSIAGAAFITGQPVLVSNASDDPRYFKRIEEETGFVARTLLAVPLQYQARRGGVLVVENRHDDVAFDQNDVDVLTALASLATIAIENTRLVETVQQIQAELQQRFAEREELLSDVTTAREAILVLQQTKEQQRRAEDVAAPRQRVGRSTLA